MRYLLKQKIQSIVPYFSSEEKLVLEFQALTNPNRQFQDKGMQVLAFHQLKWGQTEVD